MAVVRVELLCTPECLAATAAAGLLRAVLDDAGLRDVTVHRVTISSEEEARRAGFVGSPTILIDGVDPFGEPGRAPGYACRVYRTAAGPSELPDAGLLRQAVSRRQRGQCAARGPHLVR